MEYPFVPCKQAADLANTQNTYLHKLAKAGKVRAAYKTKGKLKEWYVDVTCPRYLQLQKKELKNQNGPVVAPVVSQPTLDWELWEDMLRVGDKRLVKKRCESTTIKEYKRYITNFFEAYNELTQDTLRTALKQYENKATPDQDFNASQQWLYRAMLTVGKFYLYKGIVPDNFVNELRFLKPGKSTRTPQRVFHTEDTVRKVLEALPKALNGRKQQAFTDFNIRLNSLLIRLLFLTGLRGTEAANIRLSDINYKSGKGTIKIHGKGDKTRKVGICKELRQAVKDYWSVRPESKSEFLLLHDKGQPLCCATIRRRMLRVAAYVHVDKFTPHTLRRTFARWAALDKGVSLIIVRDALGHSTLQMTNIYANTTEDDVINTMTAW